jgi:hypothetical protein
VKQIGPADLDAIGVVSINHRAFLLDAVRVLREQGAAWVYLLLGARERAEQEMYVAYDSGDGVSASSGIASAHSNWMLDDLSASSCETTTEAQKRRPRAARGQVSARKSSSPTSWHEDDWRRRGKQARGSTRSCDHQSCLTETTDCPSEVSVLTSISVATTRRSGARYGAADASCAGVINAGASLSRDELDSIQTAPSSSSSHLLPVHNSPTQLHVRSLVREKLVLEGIRLSAPPYTSTVRDGTTAAFT